MSLTVLEFFAVGMTLRALSWCAIKGGEHCHELKYLQFSRSNRGLYFQAPFS